MSGKDEVDVNKLSVKECHAMIKSATGLLRQVKVTREIVEMDIEELNRKLVKRRDQLNALLAQESQQYDSLSLSYRQLGVVELTLTPRVGDSERFDLEAWLTNSEGNGCDRIFFLTLRVDCGPRVAEEYANRLRLYRDMHNFSYNRFVEIATSEFWAYLHEKIQAEAQPPFERFFSNGRLYTFKTLMKPKRGKKK